jgi:hypothetical protein
MYQGDCKKCGKEYSEVNSRINHLESAKYSYESTKGVKGSFKKDNPEAHNILMDLAKRKVDMAVTHANHLMEGPEDSHESSAPLAVPII